MYYRCSSCDTEYQREVDRWRCECGAPLELADQRPMDRGSIDESSPSLWRYAAALPQELAQHRVSFDEGCTPLLQVPALGDGIHLKLDYLFPSSSFKDRGTTVLISELLRLGRGRLMEDSSGNAGASLATYAARAGLDCEVFVPESTSAGKLVQIRLAGATLRRIPGSREDTADAALEAADDPAQPFYASHNWHPFFIEGVKTVGFEIWEQLGFQVPDVIVAPAGNGSMILGLHRAFLELQRGGAIKTLPKIVAVQAAACAPLAAAFTDGRSDISAFDKQPTLAEGIASSRPIRARQILEALRHTDGTALAVPESALIPAVHHLAGHGFFVEPTSAVVTAALPDLRKRGILAAGATIVLILSGSGLKATERLQNV